MDRFHRPLLFYFIFLVILIPGTPQISHGIIIDCSYTFSGHVTDVWGNLESGPTVSIGDQFTGNIQLTYDSEMPPSAITDNEAIYFPLCSYKISFDDFIIQPIESPLDLPVGIRDSNDPSCNDEIWFQDESPEVICTYPDLWSEEFWFVIHYDSSTVLNSISLPTDLYVNQIGSIELWFDFQRGYHAETLFFDGNIDTFVPAPVPEPSTIVLFCFGVIGIGLLRNKLEI